MGLLGFLLAGAKMVQHDISISVEGKNNKGQRLHLHIAVSQPLVTQTFFILDTLALAFTLQEDPIIYSSPTKEP